MKSTLLISIAVLTVACGSRQTRNDKSATANDASSQSPGANTSGATPSGTTDGKVTLVGCLQGPSQPGATGTAGSAAGDRARARAAGSNADDAQRHGAAAMAHYVLTNASVEAGGVGANGAGGSGGPLVSAGSSFELDGMPADGQVSVNKQVRVTGRVDVRPAAAAGSTRSAASGAATGASGAASETSPADDVRANSTAVAGDSTNRRLTVETVQVVAQQCGAQ
jgi:hypothetical protein